MRRPKLRILSELDSGSLEHEARQRRFSKWSSLCFLKHLGLPVLDACIISPNSDPIVLKEAISRFSAKLDTGKLLLRSDGGAEKARYFRGGNSHSIDELNSVGEPLLRAGRAVILTEPTCRFSNRLSVNLLMSYEGTMVMEMLGPGFDVSDLNRGGILPEVVVQIKDIKWSRYEQPWLCDFHVTLFRSEDFSSRRLKQRLDRLSTDILPKLGEIPVTIKDLAFAETWLRRNNFMALWKAWTPPLQLHELRRYHESAFLIAAAWPHVGWRCLSSSLSILGNGRVVYWDVVDAEVKFETNAGSKNRRTVG
ncbi:hypothetical protein ACFLU6_02055 [Acidobacteriota bacterium]